MVITSQKSDHSSPDIFRVIVCCELAIFGQKSPMFETFRKSASGAELSKAGVTLVNKFNFFRFIECDISILFCFQWFILTVYPQSV